MSVRLIDTATNFKLTLDAQRAKLLTSEIAHEKKVRRHGKGIGVTSEPCCLIVVRTPAGRERRYQLFDGTVILEESTNLSWQFYAGMVVMAWLRQAQPATVPLPFAPAVP